MKWVARDRPKTDQIACPWLVRRYIDPTPRSCTSPRPDPLPPQPHWKGDPSTPPRPTTPTAAQNPPSKFIDEHHLGKDPGP